MAYDIRPLSFSEILDRAFRVYRDNFLLFVGIAAIFWLPDGILSASARVLGNAIAMTLDLIFLAVAEPVMHAALITGVASTYLNRPISIGEAYRSVRPIAISLVATSWLYFLAFVLFFSTAVGVYAAMFARRSLGVSLLALVLVVLLGAIVIEGYFIVCWGLVSSVMVIERRFGRRALRRSKELVTDSWWRTLGIVSASLVIVNVPDRTLKLIWGFVPLVGLILTHITYAVTATYAAVALVIYYFDRRCRTEDFDLRLLAEQVRAESKTAVTPAPESSALA